jgi:hypothetical protein
MGLETLLLSLLGISVTISMALIPAIYLNIKKNQELTDIRVETQRIENKRELENVNKGISDLGDDFNIDIKELKEKYHGIHTTHVQICQKHEDHMKAIDEKMNTFDSKIKGQGDFFNQRVEEFKIIVRQIEKLIKTKQT